MRSATCEVAQARGSCEAPVVLVSCFVTLDMLGGGPALLVPLGHSLAPRLLPRRHHLGGPHAAARWLVHLPTLTSVAPRWRADALSPPPSRRPLLLFRRPLRLLSLVVLAEGNPASGGSASSRGTRRRPRHGDGSQVDADAVAVDGCRGRQTERGD